ncbi:hypothetical protein B0H17DRAFT_1081334 [Mycena rosella]|uniref:Uncharacterized protein n=1 Tax=Mycena rosella TaxID=1033263 RepID=A0AAD7GA81_MYCRO|nr:hypothetical protein B0H17DRAFT_1081334 [Mycena rosella]
MSSGRDPRDLWQSPTRLYCALPAVILGTLINILDAVSTGIRVFPTEDGVFHSLQLQAFSHRKSP